MPSRASSPMAFQAARAVALPTATTTLRAQRSRASALRQSAPARQQLPHQSTRAPEHQSARAPEQPVNWPLIQVGREDVDQHAYMCSESLTAASGAVQYLDRLISRSEPLTVRMIGFHNSD